MNLNALEIGLISILILCLIIQLFYYWIVLAKPYSYMKSIADGDLQIPTAQPPVSIIISIQKINTDLSRFLTNILEQDYPEFEVIVVTDGISNTDNEALTRLKNKHINLYLTHIPEDTRNISRKKLALTLGIKASKYDCLLFTEPDSLTRTKNWIFSMVRHFSKKKSIVLGFSAVVNLNSLFQKFMAFDYFFTNLQMISLALFNRPYAGNGRSMAYTKKHFMEQKGYVKHRILKRGEDDLFINEIASENNTAVELSANSVILTEINDYRDWKRQKIDQMSTKRFYKRGPVAFWRLESFSRIIFFVAFITCFICGFPYKSTQDFLFPCIAIFCFIVRFSSQLIVINRVVERLQLEKFYFTILLFDVFQPFFNLYFFLYRLLKEKDDYTYLYENR